jgi:acyl carrier protein
VTKQEARDVMRAWVVARGKVTDADLRDDSNLLREGMINSLDVVELFVHIEDINGLSPQNCAFTGDEFRSIDTLVAAFFKESP